MSTRPAAPGHDPLCPLLTRPIDRDTLCACTLIAGVRERIATEIEAAGQAADDRFTFDTIGIPCGPAEQGATRIAYKAAARITRGRA